MSKQDYDPHFGMTRQCPLAIGPISIKAKIVSVSRSFILHHEYLPVHSWRVGVDIRRDLP